VEWLWSGRIAVGTLALLAGREGLGKSTLAYWVAARVTRGELDGVNHGIPRDVLVVATEDAWAEVVVPRLTAAGADLDRVHRVDVEQVDKDRTTMRELSLSVDMADLGRAAAEVDAALLLLDPLISRLGGRIDTHKDSSVREALEPLTRVLVATGLACIGIIHVSKSGHGDILDAVMGSKAFTAVARSVHTIMRDPEDEGRLIYGMAKQNLGRNDLPCQSFTIVAATVGTDPVIDTSRVEWGDEVEGSIREYHAAQSATADERDAVAEAGDWLEDWLATQGGEAKSAAAKKAGRVAGHSERSLERVVKARRNLGFRTEGFPRETVWCVVP
jgi:hypothetical protein